MNDLRERIARTMHDALLARYELSTPYPFDDVPDDTPVMTSKSDYYRVADAILAAIERDYKLVPTSVTMVTRRSAEELIDG